MATSLKIDDTLKGRVQHLAAIRDRSAHWIMCEAIRAYVDREEARESFKAEAHDGGAKEAAPRSHSVVSIDKALGRLGDEGEDAAQVVRAATYNQRHGLTSSTSAVNTNKAMEKTGTAKASNGLGGNGCCLVM